MFSPTLVPAVIELADLGVEACHKLRADSVEEGEGVAQEPAANGAFPAYGLIPGGPTWRSCSRVVVESVLH